MDFLTLLFVQLLLLLALIYIYAQHKNSYWSKRGIPGPKPWPFVGNVIESLRKGQVVSMREWHRQYGPIYGTYSGLRPVLNIADPELIKQVMIKDFGQLMNREKGIVLQEIDLHSLFNLEDEHWKRVRAIMSPSFTSKKLRGMSELMHQCIDKLIFYFDRITSKSDNTSTIDTKVVMTGFTIDVIASTSFATETNANDPDRSKEDGNAFVEHANKMFNLNFLNVLIVILMPRAVLRLYERIFPPNNHETFFYDLTRQLIKQKKKENGSAAEGQTKLNDFVQLLMDARVETNELNESGYEGLTASVDESEIQEPENHEFENQKSKNLESENPSQSSNSSKTKSKQKLSELEIISSSVLFFIAGFETTASTLTHCLFELATNQDIQERLYKELESHELENLEPDSYNETVLTQMPYLDATIKETLRKYPPFARLQRRVGIDSGYKLGNLILPKDQHINISGVVVHHNPEYYPEPERFNPDRFMPENKHLLVPYTFMPFGQGPRNCIGMRFAYQEIKLCLAKLLIKFQFHPTEDTPAKLELAKILLSTAKTFPLKVVKRCETNWHTTKS